MGDFAALYEQYFDDVFRYLRALTADEDLAEELTAETFFRALKSIDRFRGDCDLRVWLCQIGKNCWLSHRKKQKRLAPGDLPEDAAGEESPESLLLDKELALQLHRILHRLAEPYREVFTLRVFGELSFRQIGLIMEKNEHWACVTYHRAREKIRKEMEGQT